MPQWHAKSASEYQRILFEDLWYFAPNLNLNERFWLFMKREVLFNRAYATFSFFRQAFEGFFRCLPDKATQIARLITDRFHLIGRAPPGIPTA